MESLEENVMVGCGRQIQKRKKEDVSVVYALHDCIARSMSEEDVCQNRLSRVESPVGRLPVWQQLVDFEIIKRLLGDNIVKHFRKKRIG